MRKLSLCVTVLLMVFVPALLSNVHIAIADPGTQSIAGDVKDDRPDDADSVSGDNSTATTSISAQARAWASTSGFNLAGFEDYTASAAHTPTASDISAFEKWMSGGSNPRNQVLKEIQSLAGEEIASELWNYCNTIWKNWMNTANVGSAVSNASNLKNVGAMQEGMFAGYFGSLISNSNQGEYGNAATLIKDGFVVSSDGVTYRLHNISDGTIAYEMTAPESENVSEDKFPDGLVKFTDFLPLEKQDVTQKAKSLLKQYATAGNVNEPSGVDRAVYQAAQQYINEKFGDYYGQCPGPTVVKGIQALGIKLDSVTEDSVGSSVGEKEFVASFFGVDSAAGQLWRLGFLPSFDGTTYRLHSGKDGTVVFEINKNNLDSITDEASASSSPYIIATVSMILLVGIVILVAIWKKKRSATVS
ncbi:MAG: hypothetical protein LBI63_02980 [Candidatus Ancillula sp.]|jgi:hypothetical protein|nr:hypothetical protein [Candidatus Ancillula sp.]